MSGADERRKTDAVKLAAELLRAAEVAGYPVDEWRVLRAFKRQLGPVRYSSLDGDMLKCAVNRSADGFLARMDGGNDEGAPALRLWRLFYEDREDKAGKQRRRFTLMHELGHALLNHSAPPTEANGDEYAESPEYRAAEAQADVFAASLLAPAPAVLRLLELNGYKLETGANYPAFCDADAPFLVNLGQKPRADRLVAEAFGLSLTAAQRRLKELKGELKIWDTLDSSLCDYARALPHRAGWHCRVCGTRRRFSSLYCPGCGSMRDYVFTDPGKPCRPVINLDGDGRFEFCCVCGNMRLSKGAGFCPVCGAALTNPCENEKLSDGDFIRSGMPVIRGTHLCRPSDIYCPRCGALTRFGANHGPVKNLWRGERPRIKGAVYDEAEGANAPCGGAANGCGEHECGALDRYCPVCGKKTLLFVRGAIGDYRSTNNYLRLLEDEKYRPAPEAPQLTILPEGGFTYTEEA